MLEDNGPLLYINSTGTKIERSSEQLVYDSRNPKPTVLTTEQNVNALQERKLKNILEMYQKNRPVFCAIDYKDGHIEGIPYKCEEDKLGIIVTTETKLEIDMADLLNVTIIRF